MKSRKQHWGDLLHWPDKEETVDSLLGNDSHVYAIKIEFKQWLLSPPRFIKSNPKEKLNKSKETLLDVFQGLK